MGIHPLFPTPLRGTFDGARQRLVSESQDDTIDLWGHRPSWCSTANEFVLPNGRSGNKIEEHCGQNTCCGQVGHGVLSKASDGRGSYVAVNLISAYLHGVYPRGVSSLHLTPLIELQHDDGNGTEVDGSAHLTSGAARSLAAALIRAADQLDGLAELKGDRS